MDHLFAIVQQECSTTVWNRAQQLSRSSELKGRRTVHEELEIRVLTKAGMVSPLVVLSPHQGDWSCECPSDEPVCIHVATAVVYIHNALAVGEEIPGLKAPSATIAYRLSRSDGNLALERFIARAGELSPLNARLTAVKRQDAADDIAISQADIAVDLELRSLNDGKIPAPIMERLLTALADCRDVQLDSVPVKIGEAVPLISARVDDHPEGFILVADQDAGVAEVFANGAVLHAGVLRPIGRVDFSSRDLQELRKGRVFGFGEVADLVGRALPALQERIPVRVLSRVLPSATPMQPRLSLNLAFDGQCLSVLATLVYGDPPAARVDGGRLRYLGGALPLRDERAEQRLVDELKHKLDLEIGKARRYTGLDALHAAKAASDWKDAFLEGSGMSACFMAPDLEPKLALSGDDFELTFISKDGEAVRRATAEAVVACWQRGEPIVPLIEGGWAPLPETLLTRCGDLLADLLAAKAQNQRLPAYSAPDLARLCEELGAPCPPELTRLKALADDFKGIPKAELPEDLTATLRAYQIEGVNWLNFISNGGLGALLADEMGLGKTLQALCALKPPCLLVAPASVLPNWVKEIERFRPALRYHVYHGAGRDLDLNADVTLTTYAIMRLDTERLTARAWDTVILDEAQNIKNADSQVARAAFQLQARFRVTLSGTPVENRLEELWSQFHFLNRGLLGGRQEFQERYAKPISAGDRSTAERLRQRIRPFLLRRLKKEVASELPPRTDVTLYCTLSEREREVYQAIAATTRKEVVASLRAGGSVLAALEALLRLRQVCCHLGLIPGQSAPSSSKIELLVETLEKAIAEGHKALVFSQWTSLLDLIEPQLQNASISHLRLDGATRDRGQVVANFQDESGPPVMLVSLRAGGTGINLTAADNVFLLDPWWNPAVEDQAADRSHRIGQERPVLVHRLVAQATVEERMLELQEHKRALARAAIEGGAEATGLTREDLIALLD